MKSIDVITSVDYGYRTLWSERTYLLRLAAVPFIIKLIFLAILMLLGWEQNFLRSAVVLLPATLAEGWMLAHLARLVFLDQRWPFRPSGDAVQDALTLNDRAYGIITGTLFYAIAKHAEAGILALMASMQKASLTVDPAQASAALSPGAAFAGLMLLVFSVWAFRFMFAYIPAAAGIGLDILLRTRRGLLMSVQMIGIWLVCVVPCLILVLMTLGLMLPDPETLKATGLTLTNSQQILFVLTQAVADMLMGIIATLAIAFALRTMLEKQAPKR